MGISYDAQLLPIEAAARLANKRNALRDKYTYEMYCSAPPGYACICVFLRKEPCRFVGYWSQPTAGK
jgi:hypothetical protein